MFQGVWVGKADSHVINQYYCNNIADILPITDIGIGLLLVYRSQLCFRHFLQEAKAGED